MKHIEISVMEDGELSIDGQVKPAGNLDIREFEDGEWVGGCYATFDNLVEKVKECLEEWIYFNLRLKNETLRQKRKN